MGLSQKTRIQNKIIDLVKGATFNPVVYDPTTGYASVSAEKSLPASAFTNEVQAGYERDSKNGRDYTRTRNRWMFQLIMKFNCEVSLEGFENGVCNDPPVILRTNEFPQVILELVDKTVIHPVQQQSETGTDVRYTFLANEGRG